MKVAIGPDGMAMPSVPTTGKAETASGPWVTMAVARSAGGRSRRAEGDRDRHAVDRNRERAAREGDRVGDGERAVVDEGVRAGDVVDAGVAGVLGDRAGRRVGRRVAPVDRRGEVAGGEAAWSAGRIGIGAVNVPTIASTFWKPSTRVDRHRRPWRDHQRTDVGDVDLLVVDRVDDARAGDGDQHFAGQAGPG